MKKFKIIVFILLVLGLVGGTVAWFQYNKPHRDATSEKVAYTLSATELFEAFDLDEVQAREKYSNKLLEVSGIVAEYILGDESGGGIILLESNDMLFGVKCMLAEIPEKTPATGKAIIVKGFCSGLNGDVEMTRCAIIKH